MIISQAQQSLKAALISLKCDRESPWFSLPLPTLWLFQNSLSQTLSLIEVWNLTSACTWQEKKLITRKPPLPILPLPVLTVFPDVCFVVLHLSSIEILGVKFTRCYYSESQIHIESNHPFQASNSFSGQLMASHISFAPHPPCCQVYIYSSTWWTKSESS